MHTRGFRHTRVYPYSCAHSVAYSLMHAYSCAHSRLHTRSYACILVAYSWHTCAILVRLGVCSRQSLSQVEQTQGLSQEDQTLAAEVDAAVKNGNAAVASFDATNKRRRPIDEILQARGLRLHPLATVEPGAGRATIAKANLGIKATLNAAEQICSDLLTHSCILVSAYCAHTRQGAPAGRPARERKARQPFSPEEAPTPRKGSKRKRP